MKLRMAVATAAAVAMGAGFAVLAAGAPSHSTTLTIYGANFSAQPLTVVGKVASKKSECVSDRLVKVSAAPSGTITIIGRDRSSANGYWGVESDASGIKSVTAKAPATKVGPPNHRSTCEAASESAAEGP